MLVIGIGLLVPPPCVWVCNWSAGCACQPPTLPWLLIIPQRFIWLNSRLRYMGVLTSSLRFHLRQSSPDSMCHRSQGYWSAPGPSQSQLQCHVRGEPAPFDWPGSPVTTLRRLLVCCLSVCGLWDANDCHCLYPRPWQWFATFDCLSERDSNRPQLSINDCYPSMAQITEVGPPFTPMFTHWCRPHPAIIRAWSICPPHTKTRTWSLAFNSTAQDCAGILPVPSSSCIIVLTISSSPGVTQLMPPGVQLCLSSNWTTQHIHVLQDGSSSSIFSLGVHAFASYAANHCGLESKIIHAAVRPDPPISVPHVVMGSVPMTISNYSSFCLEHPGVPDGSDGSDRTLYPRTENFTLPAAQATGHVAFIPPLLVSAMYFGHWECLRVVGPEWLGGQIAEFTRLMYGPSGAPRSTWEHVESL